MEDTLRVMTARGRRNCMRLNPCFNGRYSQRIRQVNRNTYVVCLNPCFNGRYSQRVYSNNITDSINNVLILVLMEDTLRET